MANLAAARAKDTDDTLLHVCQTPEGAAALLRFGCNADATNKVRQLFTNEYTLHAVLVL